MPALPAGGPCLPRLLPQGGGGPRTEGRLPAGRDALPPPDPLSRRRRQLAEVLAGPASGGHALYTIAILGIFILATAVCLRAWRRGRLRPARRDLELLAVFLAWAARPTVALVAVSLVQPVYFNRYVTSSVPGLAIAIALLSARAVAVTTGPRADRSRVIIASAVLGIAAAVLFIAFSIPAAQAYYQHMDLAARYLAAQVGQDDVVARPNHSVTVAIDHYLRADHGTVRTWPQLTLWQQPYIEGLDLRQDRQALSSAPNDVWLVDDGSAAGTASSWPCSRATATSGQAPHASSSGPPPSWWCTSVAPPIDTDHWRLPASWVLPASFAALILSQVPP